MSELMDVTIRRILVALDASAHSLAALEEAASLAEAMEAELVGLFVEDTNLLRLASLPFARQLSYPSGAAEPLSGERLERELKVRAERARKALEAAAARRRRPWTFRAVRGQVVREILAAAMQADLILAG
ncbi:MAG TPA: universal stress protein, partial [Terriglobia bacterium]|nr:universal stress protein [Terriglobia bacterium]